jgi:hypothetical protein
MNSNARKKLEEFYGKKPDPVVGNEELEISGTTLSITGGNSVEVPTSIGPKGPTGDQGPQGIQGATGPQGPAGEDGNDFTVTINGASSGTVTSMVVSTKSATCTVNLSGGLSFVLALA